MTWDDGRADDRPRSISDKLVETFGPPREPAAEVTKHHEDVAASLQQRLEEVYLHVVDAARRRAPA